MEIGRLIATFKTSPDGTLRSWSVGKNKYYEIKLTVDSLPEGVKTVTYLLHPSYQSDRVQTIPYGVRGFRGDISSYRDFFITVTVEGFRPRSNEWFAVAFATKLSDALGVGYSSGARTKEVANAIERIASLYLDSPEIDLIKAGSLTPSRSDGSSKLNLQIFDGSRQLFSAPANFLITIIDGNQKQLFRDYTSSSTESFDLPFYDNFGDNYRVIVSTGGYRQAGFFPVILSDQYSRTLDIMLIPNDPGFSFVNARWEAVSAKCPFLANGVDNVTGQARYEMLLDQQEKSLACFLNLVEAAGQIKLSEGTPLDYIKQLRWDAPFGPAQDRFFAWCDPKLIDQVKIAAAAKQFAVAPAGLHPGATSSWKQIRFGEANVQLTFHENDHRTIDGVDCIMVEPDIDYYKDPAAHILFEVVPNELTQVLTDPTEVYVLRWMAGRQAGIPEFAPLYTITS